jgi:Protein of unknown function (DUF3638)
VENDFLVRPIQLKVAREMIAPTSNQNTAIQLNMGEGKSSVIAPMIAASLSDGQKFVRIVVLKPLATQMFQLLVQRLSGLANRRIYYMPFSRCTPTPQQVQLIHESFLQCMRTGGILVTQPEHVLSFKLMSIDRLLHGNSSANPTLGSKLSDAQRWLDANSRDILDESDEILHARYQLVYTVGQQQSLDGHPDRWTTVQQVLSLAKKHSLQVHRQFPSGIEVQSDHHHPESYPVIRIIQAEAGAKLVALIAHDIMTGSLPNCSFGHFSSRIRRSISQFITKMTVPSKDTQLLQAHCKGTGLWKPLLLIRGLLVHGILIYVLKERRWRVDYGLDHTRSLLAVPYRYVYSSIFNDSRTYSSISALRMSPH